MVAGSSETLGYAAEALLLDRDWRGAREQLGQALAIVNDYGELIYLPQLLLAEGAIAQICGDAGAADAAIRRAVQEARDQGAAWMQLIALVSLCERGAATSEERDELGALIDRLDEAKDTAAFARARGLLQPA
jgi:hypothetical protein